jgi:predicted nuclease of predicted toxin-antitoxin system
MKLYLDDDLAGPLLARLLRNDGHDVMLPADVGLPGVDDSVHFARAIEETRVVLTRNYRDFENLHNLVMKSQGHHPGVLLVRRDNDPSRNLSPRDIVRAIRNLEAGGLPTADHCHVLNHWR